MSFKVEKMRKMRNGNFSRRRRCVRDRQAEAVRRLICRHTHFTGGEMRVCVCAYLC